MIAVRDQTSRVASGVASGVADRGASGVGNGMERMVHAGTSADIHHNETFITLVGNTAWRKMVMREI